MKRRILTILLGALLILIGMMWRVERGRAVTNMGEFTLPDEDTYTAEAVASAIALIHDAREDPKYPCPSPQSPKPNEKSQITCRDVHSKAHGCIRAVFKVLGVDSKYRHGLFAAPGEYKTWIRYSNGTPPVHPDSTRDARGMAIKVTGVAGEKLLDGEKDADTQDFVLMNSPVYFVRNIKDYTLFAQYLGNNNPAAFFFNGFSPNPLTWQVRDMWLLLTSGQTGAPASLLGAQFYSATAYKLGPELNVRYSARPCATVNPAKVDRSKFNFLRDGLKADLAGGPACFEFMVQTQRLDKYMPVEDPTVKWSEDDSPFVPVARIEIPKQDFDTPEQNKFCEDLSFNPWHSLAAHRPLGGLNRVRKALYQEIARYRRAKMGVPFHEPKGWCLDLTWAKCE